MRSSSLVARPSPSFNRIDDGRHGRSAGQGNIVPLPPAPGGKPKPSRESQRGLDWFIFFLADVQTGFGPFIAVYLIALGLITYVPAITLAPLQLWR